MSIRRGVEAAGYLIASDTAVHGTRQGIYKRKAEIMTTPMVREIIHAVIGDFSHPPIYIEISSNGILTRPYDVESGTYHPNGIIAYTPEIIFDYEIACAICLIIQDIYPNMYDFPNVTIDVLSEQLEQGTWTTRLLLKQDYVGKAVSPMFNIDEIATIPLEELPVQLEDPKAKGNKKLPTVSICLGVASLALCWLTGVVTLVATAGIITGVLGFKTMQKKKCIAGIVMSVLGGYVLPIIIAIVSFLNMIN